MENEYIKFTIGEKKDIALIAHDNEKPKLIEWCKENYDILKKHNLYGTGTFFLCSISSSDRTIPSKSKCW